MESNRLSPYATPSTTREVLERHGLYTKYALGQNFLVNDDVVRKIVELADVRPHDCILEVGPGIGTLTAALLKCGAWVTSVEMDRDLPVVLADTLAPWADRFTLLQMDALDLEPSQLELPPGGEAPLSGRVGLPLEGAVLPPEIAMPQIVNEVPPSGDALPQLGRAVPTKMVSNLPYAVAATVVLDYFQKLPFLQSATVMVQKEVADRMMASPGSKTYGAYTVKLSLFAQPAGRFAVAPGNFFPPPRVDSAVVRLNRAQICGEDGEPLSGEELRAACVMADAAFATRRKTLQNSCKTFFANKPDVQKALPSMFAAAGIDPSRRGETLSRADFVRLGRALLAI